MESVNYDRNEFYDTGPRFTMQCYNTVTIAVNVANENELQMAQKSKLHE